MLGDVPQGDAALAVVLRSRTRVTTIMAERATILDIIAPRRLASFFDTFDLTYRRAQVLGYEPHVAAGDV